MQYWNSPRGSHISSLCTPGEEEDGDDDDEAEGATGKRAAEDDEVGRVGPPSEPRMSPEGLGAGRVSAGPEGLGWA